MEGIPNRALGSRGLHVTSKRIDGPLDSIDLERLQTILDLVDHPVVVVRDDTTLVWANVSFRQRTPHPEAGLHPWAIGEPLDHSTFLGWTGGAPHVEPLTSAPGGGALQLWMATSHATSEDLPPAPAAAIPAVSHPSGGTDVSMAQASQAEQLEILTDRLRVASKAAGIGIWDWDVQRNVLVWDDRMYELYGIDRDAFGGAYETWQQGVHPDDLEASDREVQRALAGEKPFDAVFRVVWPDGSIHWLKAYSHVRRDAEGRPERMIGINWDITELRTYQEQLAQAQQAEADARAKSEFLASMSHEIRTPMNAVIGMTSLLRDTTMTVEQLEYVEIIRNSSTELLGLINDLLDFSKIEAGRLELELVPFDLDACVAEAVELSALDASNKGVDLLYEVPPWLPELMGDSARLRQILVNLVSNAVKFTDQGEVDVRVGIDRGEGSACEIWGWVRDTGIGIPEEQRGRLFKPFNQGDSSITRKYGGTGLGLAICKELVELQGGSIEFESRVGEGTTFRFRVRAQVHRSPRPDPRFEAFQDRRILLVEENANRRRILGRRLESMGARPECVDRLELAHEQLAGAQPFDAVVLGLEWSRGEGHRWLLDFAGILPPDPPPVIALTSMGRRPDGEILGALEARGFEFADHLTKPVRHESLVQALFGALAPERRKEALAATSVQSGRIAKVLMAEDNSVNQVVTRSMLERLGHRVDIVANGVEAVAALERQAYDIVLMDVQMPEMDGLEATEQIRQLDIQPAPYIIGLTASATTEIQQACTLAGMDAFVSKPFNLPTLHQALERAVSAELSKLQGV